MNTGNLFGELKRGNVYKVAILRPLLSIPAGESVSIREEQLARIQAHFGDKDNSIAALQHLLSIAYGPPVTPALLRIDPDLDNLRGDPRFEKLCQEK